MTPKISVCIPTYNRARYIRQALGSVLHQTFQDFEIIVCDDASKDGTPEIAESFGDHRIRVIRQPERLGIPANRNAALRQARGQYIAWLDSDDIYYPEMLRTQVGVLDQYSTVGMAHAAFDIINAEGQSLRSWPVRFDADVVQPGVDAFAELSVVNYVSTSTVVSRRACHQQAGPFATDTGRSSTDWGMWLRMAMCGDVAFSATPLGACRVHGDSITAETVASGERIECDAAVVTRVFQDYRDRIPDAGRLENRARAGLAIRALIQTTDLYTAGHRSHAERCATVAGQLAGPRLISRRYRKRLSSDILVGDDYAYHRTSKALLGQLHKIIADTWYGRQIAKTARPNPKWERTQNRIAEIVARVVPPDAHMAVLDKWDPTIIHHSGRRGYHFPDRSGLSSGYPSDREAVSQLESFWKRGVSFLVFPSSAFWWLDEYGRFRGHIESHCRQVWENSDCRIFQRLMAC